jgi:hypothetical protein
MCVMAIRFHLGIIIFPARLFYRGASREFSTIPVSSSNHPTIIQYQLASRISKIDPHRVDKYLCREDDVLSDETLIERLTTPTARKELSIYKSSLPSLTSSSPIGGGGLAFVDDLIPRPTFQGQHDEELRKEWMNLLHSYRNLPYPTLFFEKLALLERKLQVGLEGEEEMTIIIGGGANG